MTASNFSSALLPVELARFTNGYIDATEPFKLAKDPAQSQRLDTVLNLSAQALYARWLACCRSSRKKPPRACTARRRSSGQATGGSFRLCPAGRCQAGRRPAFVSQSGQTGAVRAASPFCVSRVRTVALHAPDGADSGRSGTDSPWRPETGRSERCQKWVRVVTMRNSAAADGAFWGILGQVGHWGCCTFER